MNADPYYQRQKCRPMSLVSENIRYVRILAGVPVGRGLKWEWGGWRRQFLAISVANSSETSEIRPAILYGDILPLVGRWLIAKWMTKNDPEWLFHVKLCLALAVLDSEGSILKHNYAKTNECRPTCILSATKMYINNSSFWQHKSFVDIRRRFLLGRLQT